MGISCQLARLLGVILLWVTPFYMVLGGESRPCEESEQCVFWSVVDQNNKDTCCFGECEESCPLAVFLVILLFVVLPIVGCIACVGTVAIVVYCVVKNNKNQSATPPAVYHPPPMGEAYPTVAYPPYAAVNNGFNPPTRSEMPQLPQYAAVNPEAAAKM